MTLAVAPKEVAGHGLLAGKVVIVTAAAGTGIGSATARRALAEGADVVVSDHHERRLGDTAEELSALRQGPGGAIVNNASGLGWRAQHSQSHYAAAKAGVMALTRCSAIEAAEYGVRINAVSPSIARHKFLEKTSSADLLAPLSAGEAFGRAAEPWEVAATIAFLASDYSSYLTGEVISVSSQHP